ncbi:MAG: DUF5655 domain-containing protein [Christensenellales bacterium]
MDTETLLFFNRMPQALPLYQAFVARLRSEFDDFTIRVRKTQISFSNKYIFAAVSLPIRRIKGRPEIYIIVSFGLSYRVDDPRIVEATEPYPNRWTHHVVVQSEREVDGQLIEWVRRAYIFSLVK